MTAGANNKNRLPAPFAVLAMVLPALVVALGLLAVRPDWHAAFHETLHQHDHHADHAGDGHPGHPAGQDEAGCAIELFASGQIECTHGTAAPLLFSSHVSTLRVPVLDWDCLHTALEPPGRAPPCFL